jgi:hypothetical protein
MYSNVYMHLPRIHKAVELVINDNVNKGAITVTGPHSKVKTLLPLSVSRAFLTRRQYFTWRSQ